jgi:DNA invertase Pin-like site-specific DNA recombinase
MLARQTSASKQHVRGKNVAKKKMTANEQWPKRLKRLNDVVERVCGIYTRVARRLGVHRSYVSRVARGERRSETIEQALLAEYERVDNP